MEILNLNILKMLVSRSVNKIGNIIYDYGNSIWFASLGPIGQTFLGIYQISDSITAILFSPFGGAVSDKIRRKKILLISDLFCFIACFLISFINDKSILMYALIASNIILAISSAFSGPANKAFITEIVEKKDFITYNSYLEICLQIISVSSPILSYIIIKFTNLRLTLLINAFSFLLSFLLIYTIKIEDSNKELAASKKYLNMFDIFSDIHEGIKIILKNRNILFLLLISACVNFFLAIYNYLLPFSDKLLHSQSAYATMLTCGAFGAILSQKIKNKSLKSLLLNLFLSSLSVSLIPIVGMISSSVLVIAIGNLLFELFLTIFNIQFVTYIQLNIPKEFLGRVFSSIFTIALLFAPLGTTTITFSHLAINLTDFFIIGIGIFTITIIGSIFLLFNKIFR